MFFGTHNHSIDSKGRVTIPAKFRDELGDHFYMTRSINKRAIVIYPEEQWNRIAELLSNISITDSLGMMLQDEVLGYASECDVDKMGRVPIPQALKEIVGLDKEVSVVGVGKRIEIRDMGERNEQTGRPFMERLTDEQQKDISKFQIF